MARWFVTARHSACKACIRHQLGKQRVVDDRIEALKKEIRTRLGPACSHMDEATFEELVEKVAATRLRDPARVRGWTIDAAEVLQAQ